MRYYKLQVGFTEIYTTKDNPSPLHIEFNIQSFNASSAEVPGFIRVYNLPLKWFSNSKQYIGKNLKLFAGWHQSNYVNKLGYGMVLNDLIVNATITNIQADFSTINPSVFIYFNPNKDDKIQAKIEKKKQVAEAVIQVAKNGMFGAEIKKGMEKFTNWKIEISPVIAAKINGGQTWTLSVSSLDQLIHEIRRQKGIFVEADTTNKKFTLTDSEGTTIPLGVKLLKASEIIIQPELDNAGMELTTTIRLRPDLAMNQLVMFMGALPVGASVLTSNMAGISYTLFTQGIYKIKSVSHLGNFYNEDAQAWATTLSLTPKLA